MWLNIMSAMLRIMAELPALIQTAQVAFSGAPGISGPAKKSFVMGAVGAALDTYQQVAPHPLTPAQTQMVNGTISLVVDSTVAVMKAAQVLMVPVPVVTTVAPVVPPPI